MSVGVLERGTGGDCDAVDYANDPLAEVMAALEPRGWWRLGTDSGSILLDSSGNGNNGTWTGSPVFGQAPLFAGASPATSFDGTAGTGAYADVPAGIDLGGDWSLMMVLSSDVQDRPGLTGPVLSGQVGACIGSANAVSGASSSPGRLGVGYYTSGSFKRCNVAQALATPYVLVGTLDNSAGNILLYVNGLLAAVALAQPAPPTGPLVGLRIGRPYDTSTPRFDGLMSDVAMWSRALTADEVAGLYLRLTT